MIQGKSAVEETITADDAALLTILVTLERVTVMGQVTGGSTMVTRGAEEVWCVAQITASSLEHTFIPRMTVVRILMVAEVCILYYASLMFVTRGLGCCLFIKSALFLYTLNPGHVLLLQTKGPLWVEYLYNIHYRYSRYSFTFFWVNAVQFVHYWSQN